MNERRRGTAVVGYDGSPASERAVVEATPILAVKRVLVVAAGSRLLLGRRLIPP